MVDTSEKSQPNFYKKPQEKNSTIVVDNGVYELKAGYLGELSLILKNKIYKYKEKLSFEPFPSSSVKTMFDSDVVINFDILENFLDTILDFLEPTELNGLILTATPFSPTESEMLEFLFEVYKFEKIQIGYDFIYCYHKYFDKKDCVIVDFKYSSIIVAVIKDSSIRNIYKINFGGKDLQEYINYIMVDKYKESRKDYRGLVEQIRVSDNYNEEAIEILNDMCNGNYTRNMFLSDKKEINIEITKAPKKIKKSGNLNAATIPNIDYSILNATDDSLDKEMLKEKKKIKMTFFGTMARLKSRIEKTLYAFGELIENMENEVEKLNNIETYIEKKKAKFYALKRELELRDQLRRDSKNKKTREFHIKFKEGQLTPEEQSIKNLILDAEDDTQEDAMIGRLNEMAAEIILLDADFIPFYANTVGILRGDNIGRQCVNVELVKWPEIFFDPSIIGSEQMGLTEIFENICREYQIENILICGGFSFINNLETRIRNEIAQLLLGGKVNLIKASDPQKDCFFGAKFSELLPIYERKDFEKLGSSELISIKKKIINKTDL